LLETYSGGETLDHSVELSRKEKQEKKYKDLKSTKMGLAFLMGGAASGILAVSVMMVSCLSGLLSLAGLALVIVGFVFMIKGRKSLGKVHSKLVLVALAYFILAAVLSIGMSMIVSGPPDFDLLVRMTEEEVIGSDIMDTLDREQENLLPGVIAASISALSWALVAFMPSKKWGKYLIALFVILSVVLVTAGLLMQTEIFEEHIAKVQYNKYYSQTDYRELRGDLVMDQMPAMLLSAIPQLLLIIILVGAFLNMRKKENENQPRMDSRLKDLSLMDDE
jgi:hypothetical protein